MKLRHVLVLTYTIIFVMMFGIMIVTYKSLTNLMKTGDWVAHTHEVIGQANLIQKLLVDMETGQRGFLITGKEGFLDPYNSGRQQYDKTIIYLKQLVADNPSQVLLLHDVEELAGRWLSEAAIPEIQARQDIDRGTYEMIAVHNLLTKETGKSIMDKLRGKLARFVDNEKTLLDQRRDNSNKAVILTRSLVVSGTLIAITIGIMAMYQALTTFSRKVGGDPAEIEDYTRQIASGNWEKLLDDSLGTDTGILASVKQMAEDLQRKDEEKDNLIAELQKVLTEVRELRGILPICSYCKQIRDEKGAWGKVEAYIQRNIDVEFSHGICPDCQKKHSSV